MHITVGYKPSFVHTYNSLQPRLQEEVVAVVEQFKNTDNHVPLRVHKLHGPLSACFSFSVNYRYRIIFQWRDSKKQTAELLAIGTHEIYE